MTVGRLFTGGSFIHRVLREALMVIYEFREYSEYNFEGHIRGIV